MIFLTIDIGHPIGDVFLQSKCKDRGSQRQQRLLRSQAVFVKRGIFKKRGGEIEGECADVVTSALNQNNEKIVKTIHPNPLTMVS